MVIEQREGLVGVAPAQPVDREVGDQVRDVACMLDALSHFDEQGVVIGPLAGQDFPIVEAGGLGLEVPLADHGCLVTRLSQQLGKGLLRAVEGISVAALAVDVAVLAG